MHFCAAAYLYFSISAFEVGQDDTIAWSEANEFLLIEARSVEVASAKPFAFIRLSG